MKSTHAIVPIEKIQSSIFVIRGKRVMLDFHLAELYGVQTKDLKRAVRRNKDRFPEDFMFELVKEEYEALRRHFGTLKRGEHMKYLPFAFTEQGVAMLSGVLHSRRAGAVNVEIMRAFVKLRGLLTSHKDLSRKLDEFEKKFDAQFRIVFEAIRNLMTPSEKKSREIGFRIKEAKVRYRA